MTIAQSEFEERAGLIPVHGLGLSVDVYSPDLLDLDDKLRHQGAVAEYYEVFQAALPALALVRKRLDGKRLAYHGEGLWVSQPDFCASSAAGSAMQGVCAQLRALESAWLNIECATKQIAGASFGTYLPPLYTESGALVAAENAAALQHELDRDFLGRGLQPPLLLLEMPPLTYFVCGSLPIPDFFAEIARRASCGLVLDIGHLWTVYRYTGAWRFLSLDRFLSEFLDIFPLERVLEIHVAGLAAHPFETARARVLRNGDMLPRWIDAHGAPIPPLLFDMLDQVLSHRRLAKLKGLALEVDTKDSSVILSEFRAFRSRFGAAFAGLPRAVPSERSLHHLPERGMEVGGFSSGSQERKAALRHDYEHYARILTGQRGGAGPGDRPGTVSDEEGLNYFRRVYLPYEILHWGGDLQDMFPRTHAVVTESTVDIEDFVDFWFDRPRSSPLAYDFFLLKIECFLAFIAAVLPDAQGIAAREAEELRAAYEAANERAGFEETTN